MTRTATPHILAAALLFMATSAAFGADMALPEATPTSTSEPIPSGWVFQFSPYIWASGLDGDISPFRRAPTVQVDKSFSDIPDDLNVGGFANFWARKDRFVISGDVMYVNITESETTGPLPVIGGISADYDTAQFAATLQAGYRVYDTTQLTFDLLGGVRYWHLWNDLSVRVAGRTFTVENDYGWFDPVVGARAHFHINDKFSILAQGDIGGFGAGSEFTWQGLATVNYAFNEKVALSVGYKALSVDYEDDGRVFDAALSGPVVGVTFRF